MKIKEKEMKISQTYRAALIAAHTIDSAPQKPKSAPGVMQRLGLAFLACTLVIGASGFAVFSFCTRSRATTSMSRNLVRSALLPSGPCPGTILVLLSAKGRTLSAATIIPSIFPPVLASMTG